jgi:RNA polymerase sigma factor (sigma-70 family)
MMRLDWSDEDLIKRLHERDPDALEMLISRYSREMFYFIRLILDNVGVTQDVEECVNDLFVAVWQEIDTFDALRGTLHTWITMRAKYIALDRRRQLCRRQTHNVQSADEIKQWQLADTDGHRPLSGWDYDLGRSSQAEASIEYLLEQSEKREEVRQALAALPELDRFLVYQRYFRFANTHELATKTGLTRHAIDTRLWRARKCLRDVLKEHAYEFGHF